MRWFHGRVRPLLLAVIAAAMLAFAAVASGGNGTRSAGHLKHVFVIVLENHAADQVIGDPNMPYITSLADKYGVAADYYGVTHPSEPNYVAMIGGSNFGINNDDPNNRFPEKNLVDQLEANGHTWGAYMESMPAGDPLTDYWPSSSAKLYASKHNPFVLFNDIRSKPSRLARIKPYTALAADLNGPEKSIPDFSFIVPNQCHDLHGGVGTVAADGSDGTPCPYASVSNDAADVSLKQKADAFMKQTVQTIMSSKAWSGNSAIFIVADESDYDSTANSWADATGCCDSPVLQGSVYGGGLSPAIVVTTNGPRHYVSTTPYNHYSLLTTIEQNWHLGYLGNAGDTAGGVLPMNDLLGP